MKRSQILLMALPGVVGLLAAACGDDSSQTETGGSDSATEESAGVQVTDPWSRATAPSATTAAVYMTLVADTDDALIGVSVDFSIAGGTRLHDTMSADGDMDDSDMDDSDMDDSDMDGMTMVEVDEIDLPAAETVALEPGGYHIMLTDLATQLEASDMFELTLQFEHAGSQTVTVEVQAV